MARGNGHIFAPDMWATIGRAGKNGSARSGHFQLLQFWDVAYLPWPTMAAMAISAISCCQVNL